MKFQLPMMSRNRRNQDRAVKQIVVATDGSEGSGRAVDFAAQLAKTYGANLLIINVKGGYGLPVELLRQFTNAEGAWLEEMLTSRAGEILTSARDRARKIGAPTIVLESRSGNIAQAIIEFAREKNADAIIVGRQGAGRVAEFLLGSVPQKLLSLATCIVMVIP
jgi:nucleotide-binding universal stress UspA family protein